MQATNRDGILRGGSATLLRALLLAAGGISGYLLSVSLSGGQVAGCGPGSACDAVLQSRWAYVFSVPVSALALVVDLALLVTTFSCGARATPKQRRGAWEILAPGAVLMLGAALWFTALQAVVLKRFCPWCLAAHAAGATAAVMLLMRLPLASAAGGRTKGVAAAPGRLMRFCAIALAAVALLGVAQTFGPSKTFSVSVVPAAATSVAPPVAAPVATSLPPAVATQPASPVTNPAPAAPVAKAATFDVFGGRVRLDLAQVPVWGSPAAPHKLISLYDYTCHHCRDMHERVAAVGRSFGDRLAVISLPMPLDAQCNSLIRRTHPKQTNACTYARIGLGVWRAKRDALEPYDDWFFSFPTPPPLSEATNKALALVGAEAFRRATEDPWIEAQLSESIQLYNISAREYRNGNMPQFMIGTNIFAGTMTTEQLRAGVARHLGGAAR